MICKKCNHKLPADSEFCQYCGNKLEKITVVPTEPVVEELQKGKTSAVIPASSVEPNAPDETLNTNKDYTEKAFQMSLSFPDEKPKQYGDFAIRSEDVRLEQNAPRVQVCTTPTPTVSSPATPPKKEKIKYCSLCGSRIDASTKKCTGCGKQYFRGFKLNKFSITVLILSLALIASIVFIIHLLYNSQEKSNEHDKGYDYYTNSQIVEYSALAKNPELYDGELISVLGYVANVEEQLEAANGNIYNRLYMLPSKEFKTWDKEPSVIMDGAIEMEGYFFYWFEMPFVDSYIIKCDDITHSIAMEKYRDNYATVTGIFKYEDNAASIDVLYVGDYTMQPGTNKEPVAKERPETVYNIGVRTISLSQKVYTESVLAAWKNGEATEQSMIEIMDEYGASQGGGKLYIITRGEFIEEVDEWCFSPDRQVGDYAIIENAYGYTLCYISGFNITE